MRVLYILLAIIIIIMVWQILSIVSRVEYAVTNVYEIIGQPWG